MPNNPNAANPFPGPVQPNGFQTLTATCSEVAQVNLYAGNMTFQVSLVRVPTIGLPLEFYLTYNSQETVLGSVGNLWRHNLMMQLLGIGTGTITFISPSGRQYGFVQSGGNWVPDGSSYYFAGVLTNPGSNWVFTYPNGNTYTFNSSGQLTTMADPHGNSISLTYSGGNLTTVTDNTVTAPTTRTITLAYTGSLLTGITDPRGKTTTLGYDATNNNLTTITSPTGCVLQYIYATPSNHLITSRKDPNLNTYSFSYTQNAGGIWQLTGATDAESPAHSISYAYDKVTEQVATAGTPTTLDFYRATLTDAFSNTWEYRFDFSGNLWRIIDPLGHWRVFYWDAHQRPLYTSGGYQFNQNNRAASRENPNNITRGATWDASGNQLAYESGSGETSFATYDSKNEMTSYYEAQANVAVQGGWVGQYGGDGYVLCAFDSAAADVQSLPAYVSAIAPVSPATLPRLHVDEMSSTAHLLDPRTPVHATNLRRELGFYQQSNASFSFAVQMSQTKTFNLSIYTHSADMAYAGTAPLTYNEQFGRDLTLTVTDANGTQTLKIINNAPGYWATFPVTGNSGGTVQVTVAPVSPNTDARISIIAFDPIDSHKTTLTWNTTNDLTAIKQMVGSTTLTTAMTYNSNGTMATFTDANSHQTVFSYLDNYKNCTKIQDANNNVTLMTFDANGNVLTFQDANNNTWTVAWDDKNRLTSVTDMMNNVTVVSYDNAGNVQRLADANGNYTQFAYTPTNRLSQITDMLGNITKLAYDRSGNLLTVTDALNRVTQFQWDAAERLTQVTQADGTIVTAAYDALDRMVAVTSPNGNVPTLSNMILAGAGNLLRNPGAETVDPYTSTLAQNWALSGSGARDATVAHSGTASLRLASGYFTQAQVPLPPGVTAVMQFWARPDGSTNASSVYGGILRRKFDGSVSELDTATTNLPTSSTNWVQTALYRFNDPSGTNGPSAPGDAQFTRFTTDEVRLYRGGSATNVWLDDIALYAVSTALAYDGEDRLKQVRTPDGVQVQLVRDRFGRVASIVDALGRITQLQYDSLNRVVSVVDALGNSTLFQWDAVSNLSAITDGLNHATQLTYDPVDMLLKITYSDATTEQFGYDPASRLNSYTNNRNQSRSLTWDNANRLTKVTYNTDSSTVQYVVDKVGNVTQRTDRNGDVTAIAYDALYRVLQVNLTPGTGSSSHAWAQYISYDAVGNRTSFITCTVGNVYDRAKFDQDYFAQDDTTWTTPSPGYDSMNRMLDYQDRLGNQTNFSYDMEGRPITISFPNTVTTSLTYDIVDRILSSATLQGGTNLLPLAYSYDQNSNRVGLVAGNDTFDWGVDASNRLIEESINRFVERRLDRFNGGTLSQLLVQPNATDPSLGAVSLVPLADTFGAGTFSADRWRLAYVAGDPLGQEVRQQNAGLQMTYTRGYTNLTNGYFLAGPPVVYDNYGLYLTLVWAGAEHRTPFSGDFDVRVSLANFQGTPASSPPSPLLEFGLMVSDQSLEATKAGANNMAFIRLQSGGTYRTGITVGGTAQPDTTFTPGTPPTSGQLRLARTNTSTTPTITAYYWDGTTWQTLGSYGPTPSFTNAALYVSLVQDTGNAIGAGTFQNFTVAVPTNPYVGSGLYTSAIYNAGRSVTWNSISWAATVPSGTSLKFQIAVSSSPAGPWNNFIGPDGTSNTYFTSSGTAMPAGTTGQYARYQASFTGGTATPTLTRVDLLYAGTNASSERYYSYDAAGNMTQKVAEASGATTITENRTINNLNQITANQVVGTGTTNWTFTYDTSGNLKTKSDGTNLTTYNWDEDNRLTSVVLPGAGGTISYTYDPIGRMLTRSDSNGTIKFVWNGMDCVSEFAPNGTETRYYMPDGTLRSFEQGGTVYQVHSDATGSIRIITSGNGSTVSHFEYDACGVLLNSFNDPLSFPYRYVGALGVRWDSATGLYYMHQRWYDPQFSRFISRDQFYPGVLLNVRGSALKGQALPWQLQKMALFLAQTNNQYVYTMNNPANYTDPQGLCLPMLINLLEQYEPEFQAAAEETFAKIATSPTVMAMVTRGGIWRENVADVLTKASGRIQVLGQEVSMWVANAGTQRIIDIAARYNNVLVNIETKWNDSLYTNRQMIVDEYMKDSGIVVVVIRGWVSAGGSTGISPVVRFFGGGIR